MIRIGEFSKLAKTTVKTLRFYDEEDLFRPKFVDDNGYRYYEIEQLNDLRKIVELRSLDISVASIRRVLKGGDLRAVFAERLKELKEEARLTERRISLIENYLAKAEKGDFMNRYQAKEITLPAGVVYYRKGVLPDMSGLLSFILQAGAEARKHNPTMKCSGYCYVVYGAQEYKEKDVEVEYAEMTDGYGTESENIRFKEIVAEKAVSVLHKGAYARLAEAYAYAINWMKEHGYEISNPIREVYVDGCWNKESEEDYLTEIQIPVK